MNSRRSLLFMDAALTKGRTMKAGDLGCEVSRGCGGKADHRVWIPMSWERYTTQPTADCCARCKRLLGLKATNGS